MRNIYAHMSLTSHLELRKPRLKVLLLTGGRSEHDFFFFLFVFSLLSVSMCVYLHMSAHGQVRRRRWVSCSLSLSHCFLSLCLILNPELGWWPVSPHWHSCLFLSPVLEIQEALVHSFLYGYERFELRCSCLHSKHSYTRSRLSLSVISSTILFIFITLIYL